MIGWADNANARFEDADILAQQSVTLDHAIPTPTSLSGWCVCGRAVPSAAMAAFEEAINLNPSFAAAHVLLGQMYLYAGRLEEAIEQAEKGDPPQPQRSASIHMAARAGRGPLPIAAIIRRPSKPGGAPGRSTGIGRTACAMSLPGWRSSRKLPRHRQLLPSSN